MNTPEHPLWQEELMAYADGQLPPVQARSVAAHLQSCNACAEAVADAQRLSRQLAGWKVEDAPVSLSSTVLAELQLQNQRSRRSSSAGAWWTRGRVLAYSFSGVGLALVMLILAVTPSLLRSRQAANAPDMAMSMATEAVEEAQFSGQEGTQGRLGQQGQQGQQRQPFILRVIRLTLVTKDFDNVRAQIESIARQNNGYVDQLHVRGGNGPGRSLSSTLRFPQAQLESGLTELRKLGTTKEESQSSTDVTSQVVDLDARLNNARNTEQRLLALLRERTGDVKDVLESEREVARVRELIEMMVAQQKDLSNKVQYATVQLEVSEEYRAQIVEPAVPATGARLRNAAIDGVHLAIDAALGIVLAALQYGPVLLVWAALLVPVGLILWRRNHGDRRRIRPDGPSAG